MNPLATCVCLLLLFYTVESLERERSTRLASIAHATPVRTGSLLLGKASAQAAVGVAIVAGRGAGGADRDPDPGAGPPRGPPVRSWSGGSCWCRRFLLWTCFVMAVQTLTRNRYATYAVGLGVLAFTGYRLFTGEINWVGNWPLWSAASWSDISVLELDRRALVLSRVLAGGLALLFLAVTVRFFARREADATRIVHRLRPGPLLIAGLRLAPWAVVPLVAGTWLALEVSWGHEGGAAKKMAKDYWRKNLATYRDAKLPDITHVDLDLELFPETSRLPRLRHLRPGQPADTPLREIVLTGGLALGRRSRGRSTASRTSRRIARGSTSSRRPGRSAAARRHGSASATRGHSPGDQQEGRAAMEFILPSGVVLTSFRPSFVPVLGFSEQVGIEDDNRYEPREYADDFYKGQTDSMLGARAPFTTRIKLTGPADFTLNSVGIKVEDTVEGGRRTAVWESDHPVSFFNVVGGQVGRQARRGDGGLLPSRAPLQRRRDARSRSTPPASTSRHGFIPIPWKELKLSEFPNLATYAQGFPTNITFSEGIGFLTEDSPEIHAAFVITAHEAAHQWWGNIVDARQGARRQHPVRGDGPLLDDPPGRADQGAERPHRLLQADRDELRQEPASRLGAPAGQDRRHPPRRHDRDVRQGGLGLLDAHESHGPRARRSKASARSSRPTTATPTTPCSRTSWRRCARSPPTPRPTTRSRGSGSSRSSCPSIACTSRGRRARERAGRRRSGSRTSARGRCRSRSPPCAAGGSTRRARPRPSTARRGPP